MNYTPTDILHYQVFPVLYSKYLQTLNDIPIESLSIHLNFSPFQQLPNVSVICLHASTFNSPAGQHMVGVSLGYGSFTRGVEGNQSSVIWPRTCDSHIQQPRSRQEEVEEGTKQNFNCYENRPLPILYIIVNIGNKIRFCIHPEVALTNF